MLLWTDFKQCRVYSDWKKKSLFLLNDPDIMNEKKWTQKLANSFFFFFLQICEL